MRDAYGSSLGNVTLGNPLTTHVGEQGKFERRSRVPGANGRIGRPARGGGMSRSIRRVRRARLAALTGAVAVLMALLPAYCRLGGAAAEFL